MLIAKINSKGSIEKIAPYTEFGGFIEIPSQKELKEKGYRSVNLRKKHDKNSEKLTACEPYLEEPWVYTVKVEKLSTKEVEIKLQESLNEIRTQRDSLLSSCDWTQCADAPLSKEKKASWLKYRQELRDITKKFTKLSDVVWPTKPE